jgi:aryl-alcohol dehydrogenase-like predicted oxidoreductase
MQHLFRGNRIIMQYTQLGKTGLTVSRICLGCMSFGDPKWRAYVMGRAESRPFFVKALEAGINFFDTADMYSLGASEEVTGYWLRELANRDEIVITSKVHFPMSDRPNMGGLSRKHIVQACDASLRRLGIETIDLYQIHRFDPKTPIEETLAALDLLIHQGKVRYIGASAGYAWQFAHALHASDRNGWARFVSMQNHYNLIYREEEREMIPFCVAEGIGVIPFSPLARGILARAQLPWEQGAQRTARSGSDNYVTERYDSPNDPEVLAALRDVAKARGDSPAEVAMAWLLAKPGVTAPIVGATKLEHLDAAIGALDLQLGADEVAALEAPYRPHAVRGH